MEGASTQTSSARDQQTPNAPMKAYQFIATIEEKDLHIPLRLEIDCVNDMEASLVALRLVSKSLGVKVWRDGSLIYVAPSTGKHEYSSIGPESS